MYYSRLDLTIPQPVAVSTWSESIDSPYHVYATLRGLGYPVTWITPKQIMAGRLGDVSAVVMVNSQHVPHAAAEKLANWVREGGAIIGDGWPGMFDEHGKQQDSLSGIFGVQMEPPATPTGSRVAFDETAQGYGEMTDAAIELDPDKLRTTAGEIFAQWDATHPVARRMGDFLLSGLGQQNIVCRNGSVIGMFYMGKPGIVINEPGKGHAMYVAMMLGTLYEGSATGYEWDSTHSGLAFGRLLDAFLREAGVRPSAFTNLPSRAAMKMRIELPLADARGNALVGITSFNDLPVPAFELSLKWPAPLKKPETVYVCRNGSRDLVKVGFSLKDETLKVQMPGFDTYATVLALHDSEPLVSMEVAGAERGPAGLTEVAPGARLKVRATVWNPSPRKLEAGQLRLYAAPGWFCDRSEVSIPAIEPFGKTEASFEVAPPSSCAAPPIAAHCAEVPGQ